ncbi:MAG: hypothetical protein H6779_01210 [Candidatus Nomurabacteria bacterium]|nr:MAG: hypothetical protein H6779_01210 [Candidatus Nomurabacteria bacterium]
MVQKKLSAFTDDNLSQRILRDLALEFVLLESKIKTLTRLSKANRKISPRQVPVCILAKNVIDMGGKIHKSMNMRMKCRGDSLIHEAEADSSAFRISLENAIEKIIKQYRARCNTIKAIEGIDAYIFALKPY